jgi:protein-disulfide reductase (glutathione)
MQPTPPPAQQRVDPSAESKAPAAPALDPNGTGEPNGFGTAIEWRKFDVAMKEAKASDKPIMMVVHTSWCGNCKALKPSFKRPEVADMAKNFVMVNVDQDRVPAAQAHAPDGDYIPRVLFFSPDGELDVGMKNTANPRFKYFYTPRDDMTGPMKEALERNAKKG